MNKNRLLEQIINHLHNDLNTQLHGAIAAHEASTHEENIPDNKYETLALEASYLAQGQANRAQEIRLAIESYKQLKLISFDNSIEISLTALVTLNGCDGTSKMLFIGPAEGGTKIADKETGVETLIITPGSPLGKQLVGKMTGDLVTIGYGDKRKELEIVRVV